MSTEPWTTLFKTFVVPCAIGLVTSNIATVARDIGVSAYDLDSFIYNDGPLPEACAPQAGGLCLFRAHETGSGNDTLTTVPGPEPVPMKTANVASESAEET